MNRNVTAIILVALAIGIYFTFTQGQIDSAKLALADNKQYSDAIANAKKLIDVRDQVQKDANKITPADLERLDKMIPSSTNNIHLIVDLNDLANTGYHFALTNIKAEVVADNNNGAPTPLPPQSGTQGAIQNPATAQLLSPNALSQVKITFSAKTTYRQFYGFLQDLERSLRITDISKISVKGSDTGVYEFQVELRTYWIKS